MIPEYFIQEWKGSEIDYRVKQIRLTFASKKILSKQIIRQYLIKKTSPRFAAQGGHNV